MRRLDETVFMYFGPSAQKDDYPEALDFLQALTLK